MDIQELHYDLPEELIAQSPLDKRDEARLLFWNGIQNKTQHLQIKDLTACLPPSLLVFNNTKVFPARLYANKATGGKAEFLLIEPIEKENGRELWLALGKTSKGFKEGASFQIEGHLNIEIQSTKQGELQIWLTSLTEKNLQETIDQIGHIPLPPYIRRQANKSDHDRYQTVFAKHRGSVAAPTAGLHFTQALLSDLKETGHQTANVTLHVGPGTFAPVRASSLDTHPMHTEHYSIPPETITAIEKAKQENRPIIAIGTTVVRTLESAVNPDGIIHPGSSKTNLLIYPPYTFKVIDGLFTNFHLPRSTLLALVMAFAGKENTKALYQEAIDHQYRFFSYGDAMLIYPKSYT